MKTIGIDLGTTNSVVCEYTRGSARPVQIGGSKTIPSVVYLDGGGPPTVGAKAKSRTMIKPDQVLSSTKRQMGTDWSKKIQGTSYTAVDAGRMILEYLKSEVENALGDDVGGAVVTVPAYFNDQQRADTKQAAEEAGLNVLRLLPEPTAAAIAYGFQREKDQTILVFDLGGGTFDVSILDVQGDDFEVQAVEGDHNLGGDDFDDAIVEHLNSWLEEHTGSAPRGDAKAQKQLKEIAEETKIVLSESKATEIYEPNLDLDIDRFTRDEFEALIEPHLDEMISKTKNVIREAGRSADEISRIVLVGGSSKIPAIEDMITEHFRQPYKADDMDVSVAKGAAVVAASMLSPTEKAVGAGVGAAEGDARPVELRFKDVIPHSLGIDMRFPRRGTVEFVPILDKNDHYPNEGTCVGMAEPWQEVVDMNVFRGEATDLSENTKLGELSLEISKEYLGNQEVPMCAIFELDDDGILTFTQVEMPLNGTTVDDLERLLHAAGDNHRAPISDVQDLIGRHDFKTKTISLEVM